MVLTPGWPQNLKIWAAEKKSSTTLEKRDSTVQSLGIAMQDTKSQKWEVVTHPISGIATPLQATVPTIPTVPTVTGLVKWPIGLGSVKSLGSGAEANERPAPKGRHRATVKIGGALGAGPFVKRLQLGVQGFILPLLIPPMNSQEILPSLYVYISSWWYDHDQTIP